MLPLLDHVMCMHLRPSACHQGVGLVERYLWVNSPEVMAPMCVWEAAWQATQPEIEQVSR